MCALKAVNPPVPPAGKAEAVILVHGLWMTGLEFLWMAHGLRQKGLQVWTFRYPSVRSNLMDNARRLARFHEQVTSRENSPPKIHLVGHSLGGLVIAQMLQTSPERAARTGRIVALGSPFLGSASAKVISDFPLGSNVVGRCFPGAAAEAVRLPETLPCREWELDLDLGIIAGTYPVGWGQLLRVFSTPNDGIVAVEETRLPGAADHLTLPINHVALTFSKRATRQVYHFLKHGYFHRGDLQGVAALVPSA